MLLLWLQPRTAAQPVKGTEKQKTDLQETCGTTLPSAVHCGHRAGSLRLTEPAELSFVYSSCAVSPAAKAFSRWGEKPGEIGPNLELEHKLVQAKRPTEQNVRETGQVCLTMLCAENEKGG